MPNHQNNPQTNQNLFQTRHDNQPSKVAALLCALKQDAQINTLNHNNCVWLSSCTSTSDLLKNWCSKWRSATPALCISDMQTHGRGQHSKQWYSPAGHLYLSICLPLPKAVPISGRLALEVALALLHTPTLKRVIDHRGSEGNIGIKWPNDIVVQTNPKGSNIKDNDSAKNSNFAKLAGILVEPAKNKAGDTSVIIGIGINCSTHTNDEKSRIKQPTISLKELLHTDIDTTHLASEVVLACVSAVAHFTSQHSTLAARFAAFDLLLGRFITLAQSQQVAQLSGVAAGIAQDGALQVQGADGTVKLVYDGHITHIKPLTTPAQPTPNPAKNPKIQTQL